MFMMQRGYATHRGVSRCTVQKAIESGRIRTEADGIINPIRAEADWERNTRASVTSPPLSERLAGEHDARSAEEMLEVAMREALVELSGIIVD